jgi:hypothetical protein
MDLYLIQGKILKNLGCFKEAADCCVKAHQMDQSDRFTSTVTLKYCLKAGNLDLVAIKKKKTVYFQLVCTFFFISFYF